MSGSIARQYSLWASRPMGVRASLRAWSFPGKALSRCDETGVLKPGYVTREISSGESSLLMSCAKSAV